LALGYKSVSECQESITSAEYAEWLAYDALEPIIPPWRVLFGTLAATTANTVATKQSNVRTWSDFFPDWRVIEQADATPPQDIMQMVEAWNMQLGGLDLRKERKKPLTS
jgi:hypothetical protein